MSIFLSNKVAFVTGASRGIGAAIAKRLAQDGADVAITYVSSPDKAEAVVAEIKALGRKALAIRADAADFDAVQAAVRSAIAELGPIDVLVNNAGISDFSTVDAQSMQGFDKIVAVNIRAAFAATQAAAAQMPSGGRVINIGSVTGDIAFMSGLSFYGMTKAGLAAMTRGFALDLASRGITVNTVQPGPIATDMMPDSEEFLNIVPLKRYGTPGEVAGLVAYLAGPESAFMTGASLTMDGGAGIA